MKEEKRSEGGKKAHFEINPVFEPSFLFLDGDVVPGHLKKRKYQSVRQDSPETKR